MQPKNTYIVESLRLPVGKLNGYYKSIIPEVLTSFLMAKLIEKYPFLKSETDEVVIGCALGTGGNMARYATIDAGFEISTPAFTIDAQCVSGLKAIILANQQIKTSANCILAGGMESSSLAPKRQYQPHDQRFINENTFYTQAIFSPPQYGYEESLIKAAENVAHKFNLPKDSMMRWTVQSQEKAENAIEKGYLKNGIVPFQNYTKDQTIKSDLTFERLQKTQTSALIDHTNTAHLHDGVCIHLLASENYCEKFGLNPSFKISETITTAGQPNLAPMGVILATEKLLQKTGLKIDEIDLFEVNESFAVNALAFAQYFQVGQTKINIFGGNLAFGHPFGASGAINLLHLVEAMKVKNAKKGIVTIAAAGGLGMAVLIEKTAP